MSAATWSAFRPDVRGTFLDRPNRFVVRALVSGRVVEAHCPNPGRITELLFPGTTVVLEAAPEGRKLPFTLVAVERPGPGDGVTTVPLASVRSNGAVGALVLPGLFPGARRVVAEHRLGTSRFDWFVEDAGGKKHLVEVKACSEVEHGTALFPDAPSARALKHLEELSAWGDRGYCPHVVFLVCHGRPRTFGPNVHTDPRFSRTLAALSDRVRVHAVLTETREDGTTRLVDPRLTVDLTSADGPDSGLLVGLDPGTGGWVVTVDWKSEGWFKAVGRAPARRSFAIRSARDRSQALRDELAAGSHPRDGSLVFAEDPRTDRAFIDTIMRWRHNGPRD